LPARGSWRCSLERLEKVEPGDGRARTDGAISGTLQIEQSGLGDVAIDSSLSLPVPGYQELRAFWRRQQRIEQFDGFAGDPGYFDSYVNGLT
jgi:hypothetical protein